MPVGKHRDPLNRRASRPSRARHRSGIGLLPLGDRERGRRDDLVDDVGGERLDNDRYSHPLTRKVGS